MFADYVKMAVKAGLIIAITAIVIAVFANVQIPQIDTTSFVQAVGMGKAFVNYWVPVLVPFMNLFLAICALEVLCLGAYITLIAMRWIFKVNE